MTKEFKLTPVEQKEYSKRLELIQTMLARSPHLTKSHFTNHFGCRHAFLTLLEKDHGVKFGKAKRIKINLPGGFDHAPGT